MDKWLAKFLDETLEDRTDKTDIVPKSGSVSGMSGPISGIPPEIDQTQTNDVPPAPPLKPGDWVEWLSPALPKQQGEVLAVRGDDDGTFEVYHPLTEAVCRLSVSWVTRIMNASEGPMP
ncbi:MAG: hypothetical protein ABL950_01510 [Nitrospira sp.]